MICALRWWKTFFGGQLLQYQILEKQKMLTFVKDDMLTPKQWNFMPCIRRGGNFVFFEHFIAPALDLLPCLQARAARECKKGSKCLKCIFLPAFGVRSTQSLVEIYNTCWIWGLNWTWGRQLRFFSGDQQRKWRLLFRDFLGLIYGNLIFWELKFLVLNLDF